MWSKAPKHIHTEQICRATLDIPFVGFGMTKLLLLLFEVIIKLAIKVARSATL